MEECEDGGKTGLARVRELSRDEMRLEVEAEDPVEIVVPRELINITDLRDFFSIDENLFVSACMEWTTAGLIGHKVWKTIEGIGEIVDKGDVGCKLRPIGGNHPPELLVRWSMLSKTHSGLPGNIDKILRPGDQLNFVRTDEENTALVGASLPAWKNAASDSLGSIINVHPREGSAILFSHPIGRVLLRPAALGPVELVQGLRVIFRPVFLANLTRGCIWEAGAAQLDDGAMYLASDGSPVAEVYIPPLPISVVSMTLPEFRPEPMPQEGARVSIDGSGDQEIPVEEPGQEAEEESKSSIATVAYLPGASPEAEAEPEADSMAENWIQPSPQTVMEAIQEVLGRILKMDGIISVIGNSRPELLDEIEPFLHRLR